MRRSLKSLKNH